jgi:streptogramin lyase
MARFSVLCFVLLLFAVTLTGQPAPSFMRYEPGKGGLVGDYFFTVVEDSIGYLWIGGESGLLRFDGTEFVNYTSSLSHPNVRNLFVDARGILYACTSNGLDLIDPATNDIQVIYSDPEIPYTISDNNPEPVIHDGSDIVWIGTFHGLNRFDLNTGKFTRYYARPEAGPLWENRYYALLQDKYQDSILWLGSSGGLQRFNKVTGTFQFITIPLSRPASERQPRVFGIYQHADGKLWLGLNEYNMLISYDPLEQRWQIFEVGLNRRLTPNRIAGAYDIMQKSDQELWVSMVCGIGTFDMNSGSYSWLELDDDLPDAPLASAARRLFIDSKGHFWIPSLNGISRSREPIKDPSGSGQKVIPIRVLIDGIEVPRPYDSLSTTLEIAFHQKTLQTDFRLLNPTYPDSVEYAYRLLGHNNDWIHSDTGTVRYANLGQGSYVLEMRARERRGPWSEIISFPVKVKTAWWRSPWFYGGVLTFMAAIILIIMTIRAMHRRKEAHLRSEYEHELAQVQMEALRAQMNPHFLFNTMNSINHYILKNERRSASAYLTKFSRLIRLVLNHSKADLVPLADELEALKLYIQLEQLRFEQQFTYTLTVDDNVRTEEVAIPPLLIQPYVENAIWHGLMQKEGSGKLDIMISGTDQHLRVRIRDDGIGREAAKAYKASLGKSKSFGTTITQNRINLVNNLHGIETEVKTNDLYDEAGNATGTEVVLTIPLTTTPNLVREA